MPQHAWDVSTKVASRPCAIWAFIDMANGIATPIIDRGRNGWSGNNRRAASESSAAAPTWICGDRSIV